MVDICSFGVGGGHYLYMTRSTIPYTTLPPTIVHGAEVAQPVHRCSSVVVAGMIPDPAPQYSQIPFLNAFPPQFRQFLGIFLFRPLFKQMLKCFNSGLSLPPGNQARNTTVLRIVSRQRTH